MTDVKKVLDGWKRCQKCNSTRSKAYLECEYTVGLYCGKDNLVYDTINVLQELEADITALKSAYKELAEKGEIVVRCQDCIFGQPIEERYICTNSKHCQSKSNEPGWFCADGRKKDDKSILR